MTNGSKGNLVLSGNGEVTGGNFERVIINGNGKINGNIACNDFECNGSAKIMGDVQSENGVIKGNTKITGNVETNKIEIQGNATVGGTIQFGTMALFGNTSIKGGAKGEVINLEGIVKIGADCEVEIANLSGAFTIDGLLNADKLLINLHGRSSVKEIGGEMITVTRENAPLLHLDKFFKVLSKELMVDVVEGDIIKLEYTKAKVVRGNVVEIGPGCEIELLEYSKDCHISEGATVKETKKV